MKILHVAGNKCVIILSLKCLYELYSSYLDSYRLKTETQRRLCHLLRNDAMTVKEITAAIYSLPAPMNLMSSFPN